MRKTSIWKWHSGKAPIVFGQHVWKSKYLEQSSVIANATLDFTVSGDSHCSFCGTSNMGANSPISLLVAVLFRHCMNDQTHGTGSWLVACFLESPTLVSHTTFPSEKKNSICRCRLGLIWMHGVRVFTALSFNAATGVRIEETGFDMQLPKLPRIQSSSAQFLMRDWTGSHLAHWQHCYRFRHWHCFRHSLTHCFPLLIRSRLSWTARTTAWTTTAWTARELKLVVHTSDPSWNGAPSSLNTVLGM